VYEHLRVLENLHPRGFPTSMALDPAVVGFLLVNVAMGRCLCSFHPHWTVSNPQPSDSRRIQATHHTLHRFITTQLDKQANGGVSKESYSVGAEYKCYAIHSQQHQLYIVFNNTLPIYAIRSVAAKTLDILTKGKSLHF